MMMGEAIWFVRGIFYGMALATTVGLWLWFEESTWIKHDNRIGSHGADTYLVKRTSSARVFFIVIAGIFWPLVLVCIALRWIISIPFVIYRKTDK